MNLQFCLLQKLNFSTMRPFLILFDSGKWNLLHVSLTLCFPKPGHPHITCHLNTFLKWKNVRTEIYIYVLFTIRFHRHETLLSLVFAHGIFCLYFMGHATTYNQTLPIIQAIVSILAYHPFIIGITMILKIATCSTIQLLYMHH